MSRIRVAQRSKVKLKLAVSGLSGSGKTYSSLLLARGMVDDWTKVGLVDSENGSGELYSNLGGYQYLDLRFGADGKPIRDPHSPENYIACIKEMYHAGVEVIVLDSITHEWDGLGGCLESVERLGGRFSDWAKVTPRHKSFLDAILQVPCHVIATMRKKSDYTIGEEERNGKMRQTVEKVGLKEIQREGIEYEFTVQFTIDRRHIATAAKDRTGMYRSESPFKLDSDIGKQLLEWANGVGPEQSARGSSETQQSSGNSGSSGDESSKTSYRATPQDKRILVNAAKKAGITEPVTLKALSEEMTGLHMSEMDAKIAAMKAKLSEVQGAPT